MSRTELNKGYRASARIEELWKRAQAQPDEMFLPMLRALFYLDGWMAAKNEGLPMRNAAAYVRDALQSVLAQEHGALQLVVVDDGSTDASRAVVEAIGDPRLRLVAGPQRGIAAAWNAGLAAADGDVVMQCDADDLFTAGRIGRQLALLRALPEFGAVCGGFCTMDPTGRLVADLWDPRASGEEITTELRLGVTRTHFNTFAVRRAHLVALGGKREYFETAEDIDLQLRLWEACRVWYEPAGVYRYRLHDASVTHSQPSAQRVFFEAYARALCAQRAAGEPDDLQRGAPRVPPEGSSRPSRAVEQIGRMRLGAAWRSHARGERLEAIRLGIRALAESPLDVRTWRSVAALFLKPNRSERRS